MPVTSGKRAAPLVGGDEHQPLAPRLISNGTDRPVDAAARLARGFERGGRDFASQQIPALGADDIDRFVMTPGLAPDQVTQGVDAAMTQRRLGTVEQHPRTRPAVDADLAHPLGLLHPVIGIADGQAGEQQRRPEGEQDLPEQAVQDFRCNAQDRGDRRGGN